MRLGCPHPSSLGSPLMNATKDWIASPTLDLDFMRAGTGLSDLALYSLPETGLGLQKSSEKSW